MKYQNKINNDVDRCGCWDFIWFFVCLLLLTLGFVGATLLVGVK